LQGATAATVTTTTTITTTANQDDNNSDDESDEQGQQQGEEESDRTRAHTALTYLGRLVVYRCPQLLTLATNYDAP
jgi:hypothetical protein